jgi:ubiquinone/menaquinone biosynthesis C-methylase UbiE
MRDWEDHDMRRWERYLLWRRRLIGETGREAYERLLEEYATFNTIWLDAGCGHFSFHNRHRERRIRDNVRAAFGCDLDFASLKVSSSVMSVVQANLEAIPYQTQTFDLATMNSVAEHLADPLAVFKEIARVLKPRGRFIMHTPNVHSYYALASCLLPESIKPAVVEWLEGRVAADVYPTFYRTNSPKQITPLFEAAGFQNVQIFILPTEATTAGLWQPVWFAELIFLRLTPRRWRTNLCVIAEKRA